MHGYNEINRITTFLNSILSKNVAEKAEWGWSG